MPLLWVVENAWNRNLEDAGAKRFQCDSGAAGTSHQGYSSLHGRPRLAATVADAKRLEAERDRLMKEGDAIAYARRLLAA